MKKNDLLKIIKKGQLWKCKRPPYKTIRLIAKGRTKDWFGEGQNGDTHGINSRLLLKHWELMEG